MKHKVKGYPEARRASALLADAVELLNMTGLRLIAAKTQDAHEDLVDWLAQSLADFIRSPEFLDAGHNTD